MNITKRSLKKCVSCAKFVQPVEHSCPFCASELTELSSPKKVSTAAKMGIMAVSFFGATAVMGCAYGAPPADCTKQACTSGYVCNTTTKQCEPGSDENNAGETNSASDAGATGG